MHRCPLPADPPALVPTTRTTPDRGTGAHPSGIGRTVTPRRQNHAPTPTEAHPDDHRQPDERSGLAVALYAAVASSTLSYLAYRAGGGRVVLSAHADVTLEPFPAGTVDVQAN